MSGCADTLAQQAIRLLLDGAAPAALPHAEPPAYGPWAGAIDALLVAHGAGGPEAVTRTFVALTHQDPALVSLMAGGGHPAVQRLWTVAQLYASDFPPPRFVVPDLLPTGLSILAGRPKLGKSWLALQLAAAVGAGSAALGEPTPQGRVLYLALEDTPRRLKDRLQKMGVPESADVTFATEWPALAETGAMALKAEMERGYALVIVDTLSRALGRADQMDAADMTQIMGSLQRLAAAHDLALLLVDHHRKPAGGGPASADPIDDIFGSTAKAGVVDAALGLYRAHGEDEATLRVTGRDLSEREVALRWEAEQFCWTTQTAAEAGRLTHRQEEALTALRSVGRASLCELAELTGQNKSNLYRRLQLMVKAGQVTRVEESGRITYMPPGEQLALNMDGSAPDGEPVVSEDELLFGGER